MLSPMFESAGTVEKREPEAESRGVSEKQFTDIGPDAGLLRSQEPELARHARQPDSGATGEDQTETHTADEQPGQEARELKP